MSLPQLLRFLVIKYLLIIPLWFIIMESSPSSIFIFMLLLFVIGDAARLVAHHRNSSNAEPLPIPPWLQNQYLHTLVALAITFCIMYYS